MGHPRPIAPVKAATKMSVRALREPTNPADVIGASRFVQPIRHPESSPGQHKRIILLFDSCITNLIRDAFPVQWDERIGRRLKLRDLHILLAVVEHGSMGKAASALAISQPAVSKAIADMEYTLGLRLLDRARHGMEPTTYGRALISRGATVFDELRQAVEALKFLADPTAGEFCVWVSKAMAARVLPDFLHAACRPESLAASNPLLGVFQLVHFRDFE